MDQQEVKACVPKVPSVPKVAQEGKVKLDGSWKPGFQALLHIKNHWLRKKKAPALLFEPDHTAGICNSSLRTGEVLIVCKSFFATF